MSSYIAYDAQKVISACNKLLYQIAESRQEDIDEYVQDYMNRKFFKCLSVEEAIGKIKRKNIFYGANFSIYDWIMEIRYAEKEDAATRLKKLAETKLKSVGHGGSANVYLCGKDCELISKYL